MSPDALAPPEAARARLFTMTDPDRRPPIIPSHIAWPAFVVLLLALSVGAAVVTLIAARSDGGPRLVEQEAPGG